MITLITAIVAAIGMGIAVYPAVSEAIDGGSSSTTTIASPSSYDDQITTTTTVDDMTPPTTYPNWDPSCNSMDPGYDNCETVATTPYLDTTPPAETWESMGFAAYTPLTIEQVIPGMQICRVYVGNDGYMEDLIVHEVINFVPKSPEAALPVYGSDDSFRVLVEWTSDLTGDTEAFLDLRYASDMGLTGDRQDEVRTFAGTCRAPISAEDVVTVVDLPPTL